MSPTGTAEPAASTQPVSLERQICEIVRELLLEQGKERAAANVTPKSSFQNDLGISSLDLVEIVVRCEARLDIEVPDEIAEQADTPAGWAKAIREGSEKSAARSVYRISPPGGEPVALPAAASNLVDVLRWHSEAAHGRVHIHLIEDGSGQGITCDRLLDGASRVARGLISLGLVRNDTVAILLPTGLDFFESFFGVQLAGGVPVPLYPPADLSRISEYVQRQIHILRAAGIRYLIGFDQAASISRILRVNVPTLIEATSAAELRRYGIRTSARFPEPSRIAVVQFTSGTTADPKGVVLTHENVLANVRAIGRAVGVRPDDAVVSWLPMASDLGLVGCWLFALYHAAPITILRPQDFLERPESWLWAIHDSRGTLSAAPNFAYELCARRIPMWTLEGIDLSCWRVAVNAGEAVMPETMERFTRRFRGLGFRPEAVTPAYGLAENTVAVAIADPGSVPRVERGIPSVGPPLEGHEVRIAGPDGRELPEGEIGRLLFRGPSRCSGYMHRGAVVRASEPADWTDSGDLAFQLGGEIFFAGRAKDVLVRRGRVISPEPVERAAGDVAGVCHDGAALVGVPDPEAGTDRLVLVAESAAHGAGETARVARSVRAAAETALGEELDEIRIVPPGTLPKTTNRKLRRGELRQRILDGTLAKSGAPVGAQMAGLWWSNLGGLGSRAASKVYRQARAALRGALARSLAACGASAPAVLDALGRRPTPEGTQMRGGVVIVSNRCTRLDALSVVSLVEGTCVLAGEEALLGLPAWAADILRPRLVRTAEQMESALRADTTVILFPDSPLGTPVPRCRYRLAALEAAARAGAPVLPFGMQIIRNKLFFRVGAKISAGGREPRELRAEVRRAIQNIYA